MRVYLIAAPEDKAQGEALTAFLKQYGVFVRAEFGQFAYPPAQHGEMTLALWSRAAMMSTRQMMLTNRAIDAWSEGTLVMARLEHGLNPRGLADLNMIDLTFEPVREMRYRDVLNALRRLDDERRGRLQPRTPEPQAPPRSGASVGAGPGGFGSAPSEDHLALEDGDDETSASRMLRLLEEARSARNEMEDRGQEEAAEASEAAARKRAQIREMRSHAPLAANRMGAAERAPAKSSAAGGLIRFAALVAVAAGLGWAIWSSLLTWQQAAIVGGGALVALILVSAIISLLASADRSRAASRRTASSAAPRPAPMAEAPAAPEPQPAPPATPVAAERDSDPHDAFVSYSHSNADTVLPIVSKVEETGLRIWIDRHDIRAGDMWAGRIVQAIKASGRFCLMCSQQAFASDHVRREVYLADKYDKDMLPVRLDDAEMPEDIEYFLIGRQWVDLTALPDEEKAEAIRAVLAGATPV